MYYIKLVDGEWTLGAIISDKSARVIGFTEDVSVSFCCFFFRLLPTVSGRHDTSLYIYLEKTLNA